MRTQKTFQATALVALTLALGAAPIAAEDLTIVSSVTTGKGAPTTATQYVAADKMRTSDGRMDTIFDVTSGRMVHVDHKKKTYWETTLQELRAQFEELEKALGEGNPVMAMIGGGATEVEVSKGSGSRTIAGYTCDQYLLTIGKKLRFEIWAARGLEVPPAYYDASKLAYAAMGPMGARFDKLYEEMKKIAGLPLASKLDSKFMGFKIRTSSEATEVRKGPIPAGTFDPPAGYKKTKSPYKKK